MKNFVTRGPLLIVAAFLFTALPVSAQEAGHDPDLLEGLIEDDSSASTPETAASAAVEEAKTSTAESQEASDKDSVATTEDVHSEKGPSDEGQVEHTDGGLQIYESEDTVVTGTRTAKRLSSTPVKTEVIGRTELEQKNAFNLADALESETGVRVENNCQNCGFNQVRLNGLEGRYTQILIDGRPVVSSMAGVYLLEQIPEEMIDRLEIVKGGGSALYGGNAIGGVVNVITTRPNKSFANMSIQAGGLGIGVNGIGDEGFDTKLSASGAVVNKAKNLRLHVFGSGRIRGDYDYDMDGFSDIGRLRGVNAGAEAFFNPMRDAELSGKFHAIHENRRGGDQMALPEHDAWVAEAVKMYRFSGDINWTHKVNDLFDYQIGYSIAHTQRDSYYGSGGGVRLPEVPDSIADWNQQMLDEFLEIYGSKLTALKAYGNTTNPVHVVDGLMNFNFDAKGKHIITTGLQFSADMLKDQYPGYQEVMPPLDETYTDIGAFVQHNWEFAKWGEWVIGLRIDKHSELKQVIPSPRLALMFKPAEWLRMRTSFSTGFRAPQIFDEDLHITIINGEGQWINNPANLEAEKSYSVSQQLEFVTPINNAWRFRGSVNGFFTMIDDAFALHQNDNPDTEGIMEFDRINRGRTIVGGIEAEVSFKMRNILEIGTAWTWERSYNSEEDPDFGTKHIFRTPEVYGSVTFTATPYKGLELRTALDITGPMWAPHYAGYIAEDRLERTPWFFDWDISVGYKAEFNNGAYIKPFLVVYNILNSFQKDMDQGMDRDAGYVYGPRMPRAIFGGIKFGI